MTSERPSESLSEPFVQEMTERTIPGLGVVLYIRIYTNDYRRLGWEEVWETFKDRYPGKWALQVFPPGEELVNDTNMYHLFVTDYIPAGLNINRR